MPAKADLKPPRGPRMLIVDDEDSITKTMRMMFEERGFHVSTAASCAEALRDLGDGQKYDAVITDLNMETADIGLEVARAAKRASPAPVVVVCTGYANLNNARVALDMHVDYLVTKPVDLDVLFSAVDRLLARRHDDASGTSTRASSRKPKSPATSRRNP